MHLQSVDTLLNVVLMPFWLQLWLPSNKRFTINPHLTTLQFITRYPIEFLRPLLPRVPTRAIAAMALIFLLLFRGVVFWASPADSMAHWPLRMGCDVFTAHDSSLTAFLAFSALSFLRFLFSLTGVCMLYLGFRKRSAWGPVTDTVYESARPLSSLPRFWRIPAFLLCGAILVFLFLFADSMHTPAGFQESPVVGKIGRIAVVLLSGWVDSLRIITFLLFSFILASWLTLSPRFARMSFMARDWITFLLGPLARHPLRFGALDLTPILAFVVLRYGYAYLLAFFTDLYRHIP